MQTAWEPRRKPAPKSDRFCPVCGLPVTGLAGKSSAERAVAACSDRCSIALRVLVALRELERRSPAVKRKRIAATLAGVDPPAAMSDLLLARWRRGEWLPRPEDLAAVRWPTRGPNPRNRRPLELWTRTPRGHGKAA